MSLNENSIKIDDNQVENLDSNNQNSSFSKKKIDINTTTQSDNADKDFISKEQSSNKTNREINSPKISWCKNYKNKRIMIIFSMTLICTLVIGFLVYLLIKSKKKKVENKPEVENKPDVDIIPEILKQENETKPVEEIKPKNETKPKDEEIKTEEETKNEEEEKTEEEKKTEEEEKNESEEEKNESEAENVIKEEENEVEEEKKPVFERINLDDINVEDVNTVIGEKVEENHKIINDSLNNIDEILNNIETIKSEVVNKINYEPNNLTIPSFLTNPSDSNAHKIAIAKEDFDLYNEKYKELSEKANEISQKTSDSINEITEPINNLRNEIDEISEQFDEIMKNLCLPLILEQKGLIDTSESNLRRLEIDELRDEYKNLIKQFNKFYKFFLNSLNYSIDAVVKVLEEIINSNCELNDYISDGISNFTDLIENTNIDNVHYDLIKIKNNFLNLKEELNEKINKFDESISNFEILNKKLQNDFLEFQNNFDDLIENITGISNLYIEKTSKMKEIELIIKNNCSNLNIYSTLKSIFNVYETTIKIQYATKESFHSIEITISLIEMKTSLDLLFVIDITGSMSPYINEVKSKLIDIINRIIDQSPGIDINLGFIGYRDKGENYTDIDFTKNVNDLKSQIENVYAIGGGDLPEDVLFALQLTLKKSWKSNAKFIVFVADAPGRGEKEIENSLEKLAINNISMFCLKIHSRTDSMFDTFKNIYKKYETAVFKLVDKGNFINEVVNSCIEYYSTHRDIK